MLRDGEWSVRPMAGGSSAGRYSFVSLSGQCEMNMNTGLTFSFLFTYIYTIYIRTTEKQTCNTLLDGVYLFVVFFIYLFPRFLYTD